MHLFFQFFVDILYGCIFVWDAYIFFLLNFSRLLFYQVYKSNQTGILQSSLILFSALIAQCIELCLLMYCCCYSLQIEREWLWGCKFTWLPALLVKSRALFRLEKRQSKCSLHKSIWSKVQHSGYSTIAHIILST